MTRHYYGKVRPVHIADRPLNPQVHLCSSAEKHRLQLILLCCNSNGDYHKIQRQIFMDPVSNRDFSLKIVPTESINNFGWKTIQNYRVVT
mgnify:CR=1 FL=1